ncbi:MAG TPA: DUF308 domain-containing protein [Pelovirga sp.]|nr:DUF308 domain-containing protein [Pelovirga sp.]
MSNVQQPDDAFEMDSKETRNRLRILGVFWAILGGAAIAAAIVATLTTMLIFGVLLLLAGVAQLAYVFSQPSEDRSWQIATGVLYSLVGFLLIIDPVSGAIGLTLLLAVLFLIRGVMQLALSVTFQRRGQSKIWYLVSGVLSLLLAVLIIAGWPETGTWVIGLFVGIELLLGGVTLLMTPGAVAEKMQFNKY